MLVYLVAFNRESVHPLFAINKNRLPLAERESNKSGVSVFYHLPVIERENKALA